jgi:DNA modification methylase
MEIKNIPIGKIKPFEKNAKKHDKKQIDQVARSIERFGWAQPLVVDKANTLIIGHCRLLAAQQLGLKEVPVLTLEALSEKEVAALRLADNKLNESDWDMALVLPELKDLTPDLMALTGFNADLLIEPDEKDDVVPEDAPPVCKLGDVWQLGEHRVKCGDATVITDVESLMNGEKADCVVTDPPYNTGMKPKPEDAKARLSHMFNDVIENWPEFLKDVFSNYLIATKGECVFYVFIDWRRVGDIRNEMEKSMDVKNVIVWDKKVHGLGSDYKSTYELCVVGKKGKPEIKNRFGLDYQDIWRLQREMGRNEFHATVKPVELLEKPIKHASKEDDIVLDFFGGSGSTLIACEKMNRRCFMMEKMPKYVDVIIKRWEDFSGKKAVKL